MREIDNSSINSLNFKGVQKPAQEDSAAEIIQTPAKEQKEINDLSAMPAATLGKSQVQTDSIEADIKFMEKNPALAAAITQAIDDYAKTHTEDETLQMIEKMHQEFVKK